MGLTFVTVITAYLHIGVVIGLLPTTGLTLPFVSYGRSNIVLTMFLTGVLVNIGSAKERVIGERRDRPARARRRALSVAASRDQVTVLFAGGGTGGHLYPGLAIARTLVRLDPRVRPFFIGAERGIEKHVLPGTEFPHLLLDLHPLYRSRPWKNWRTLARRGRAHGAPSARSLGASGRGWSSAPAATRRASRSPTPSCIASRSCSRRATAIPGLTARAFRRWTRETYLAFPEAARVLGGDRGAAHRHRRADRAAAVAASRPRCGARGVGLPADRRPRAADLRRQPGLAAR